MSIVVSDLQEQRDLDLLAVAWCDIPTYIRLFKNDFVPDADTVDGDFTQADFAGYSEQSPCPWSSARTDSLGRAYIVSQCLVFSGSGASQVVYGWYLSAEDGQTYACERFDEPVTLGSAYPDLCFQIRFLLRQLVLT